MCPERPRWARAEFLISGAELQRNNIGYIEKVIRKDASMQREAAYAAVVVLFVVVLAAYAVRARNKPSTPGSKGHQASPAIPAPVKAKILEVREAARTLDAITSSLTAGIDDPACAAVWAGSDEKQTAASQLKFHAKSLLGGLDQPLESLWADMGRTPGLSDVYSRRAAVDRAYAAYVARWEEGAARQACPAAKDLKTMLDKMSALRAAHESLSGAMGRARDAIRANPPPAAE